MTTLLLVGGEMLINSTMSRMTGSRREDSWAEKDIDFLREVYHSYPEYRAMLTPIEGKTIQLHEDYSTWHCVSSTDERGDYERVFHYEVPKDNE